MDRFELRRCVIWELADREEADDVDVDVDVVNGRPATLLFQKRGAKDEGNGNGDDGDKEEEKCGSWLGRTDDDEYFWDIVEDQSTCARKRRNVYLLENIWRKGKAHREKILVVVPDEDDGDDDNKTGIAMLERVYTEQGLFQDKENELPIALSANGILEEGAIEALEEREEDEPSLVATGIARAGEMVAAGILKSAEVASAAISRGSSFIESHIQPRQEPLEVPPEVKSGISKVKTFSKSVSDVSAEIVSTVGELASGLAANLSRGIKGNINEENEVEAEAETAKSNNSNRSQVLKTAKEVAAAALVAAGSITVAATQGARKVCTSTAEATSAIAKARHGESVGETVDDALCVAGHALDTAIAARSMTIRATSKAVITKAVASSDNNTSSLETTTNFHRVMIEEVGEDDGDGSGDDNEEKEDENPSLSTSTSRLLLFDQLPDPPPPDE